MSLYFYFLIDSRSFTLRPASRSREGLRSTRRLLSLLGAGSVGESRSCSSSMVRLKSTEPMKLWMHEMSCSVFKKHLKSLSEPTETRKFKASCGGTRRHSGTSLHDV